MDEKWIENAYWVLPGRLLAGEYPIAQELRIARAKLKWLLEAGVDSFLDLTEEGEYGLKPYQHLLAESVADQGAEASYARCSIADMSVPSREEMVRILDRLEGEIQQGRTVYLHCYGGRGRTGTVVGCYLVRNGLDGARALEQVTNLRRGLPKGHFDSPETEEQRRMVLGWKPGQ